MPDTLPLYNCRITKVYLEYLRKNYPNMDIDPILEYAGMTEYEVEDQAHWFNQNQVDRFNEIIIKTTGDPEIPRKAGRFATSSKGLGAAKQYALGLLNLGSLYLLMSKVYLIFSRAASVKAKKIGYNKVEIISTPKENVKEKPYQCEYRMGMFESAAKYFLKNFATVEHPTCFHRGHTSCRYIITWEKRPSLLWKRISNYSLVAGILICPGLYFIVPSAIWKIFVFFFVTIILSLGLYAANLEKKELADTLENQGNTAKDLLDEMKIRHDNALLVQEIGTAISSVLDIDELVRTVVETMKMYMDFDRTVILLSNDYKTRLNYTAGYGYNDKQEAIMKSMAFNLDNPDSRGLFVLAFREQKPFLINDIAQIEQKFSQRSVQFAKDTNVHSLICVPIIYEKESLGILCADNVRSKKPLTNSDMNLLMGVTSQTAVGIMHALSFQKIQESEKKYRDLVENANNIIMRIDIMGNITFFNEYAQKLSGYTEIEILGKSAMVAIRPVKEAKKSHFSTIISSLKQNPDQIIFSERKNILRNDKIVWIAWTHKPILNSDKTFNEILCIGNVITDLKKAEQEKKDLEARLQRAHKMEAIGTLAGGVAHDLNNVLSGIVSYPELLLMKLSPDSPFKKPILKIQKSGEKAAAIVQDLLTLARRGVVTTVVVNINSVIEEYLKSPEFESIKRGHPGVQIKIDLYEDVLNISGSPVHLSKTIMNLVTNALEAINDTGEILISTINIHVDTTINGYDEVKSGDYVALSVSDTGIGISSQDLERIFEPFYTKKVMGKSGTGLGMAVVWGTVKDHNGYIDVKSKEGKGTRFTLYFPVVRQELPSDKAITSFEEFKGNGESILIVDDIQDQREIASEMLIKLGYSVTSLPSGEEAVAYMKNNYADLVVMDMIMEPGLDGLDTYRKIIESKPDQKAIITSGFSESERVKEARKLGVNAYIKKPYLIETIGQVVKAEMDNS